MFNRKALMAGAIALGIAACSAAALASPYGVKIGVLNCTVDSGWGYVLGSSKDVHCTYHPNHGDDDHYVGSISKFGLDIGYTSSGTVVWDVVAPTSDMHAGALQGDYAGATASATVAAGLGANLLLGGFDKSIALQPVSFNASSGLDIAAGVGALDLRAAPHVANVPTTTQQLVAAPQAERFEVPFAFDDARLTRLSRRIVREAAREADQTHPVRILVIGHADHVGTDRYNDGLSLRRAEAVRAELVRNGLDDNLIFVAGRGYHDPVMPDGRGVREPENRHVVIELRGRFEQRQAELWRK